MIEEAVSGVNNFFWIEDIKDLKKYKKAKIPEVRPKNSRVSERVFFVVVVLVLIFIYIS